MVFDNHVFTYSNIFLNCAALKQIAQNKSKTIRDTLLVKLDMFQCQHRDGTAACMNTLIDEEILSLLFSSATSSNSC